MMKRIGILLPPDFQVLHLMAGTVYELANSLAGEDCYAVSLLSEHGGVVASSSGTGVLTQACARVDYDTLLVAGQTVPTTPSAHGWRKTASSSTRGASGPRPA